MSLQSMIQSSGNPNIAFERQIARKDNPSKFHTVYLIIWSFCIFKFIYFLKAICDPKVSICRTCMVIYIYAQRRMSCFSAEVLLAWFTSYYENMYFSRALRATDFTFWDFHCLFHSLKWSPRVEIKYCLVFLSAKAVMNLRRKTAV